jgi:hypothetical protein
VLKRAFSGSILNAHLNALSVTLNGYRRLLLNNYLDDIPLTRFVRGRTRKRLQVLQPPMFALALESGLNARLRLDGEADRQGVRGANHISVAAAQTGAAACEPQTSSTHVRTSLSWKKSQRLRAHLSQLPFARSLKHPRRILRNTGKDSLGITMFDSLCNDDRPVVLHR